LNIEATGVENGYIESFHGRLRDECLNVEVFLDLAAARRKLDTWRSDYNQRRPHRSLADRTPDEFASVAMQLSSALSLEERAEGPTQEAVCVERFK
jgi:Integrase core domain